MESVERLSNLLRESEGYALLRNPDVATELDRGGDVDLLVADPRAFARRLVQELGPPFVYIRRSHLQSFFWKWGHVDLFSALDWRGAMYLPTAQVLASASRNPMGFLEASGSHQALVCWFGPLLWGWFFKEKYRELIVREAGESGERLCRHLVNAVGSFWARRLVEAAQAGNPEVSEGWVRSLRRALWWRAFSRFPQATLMGWANYWQAQVRRVLLPPAPWVAVMGPDGSGKSSLLDALKERLRYRRPFMGVRLRHWRPGRIRRDKLSGPVVDPHGKPPRGVLASSIKIGLLLADWLIGYWTDLAPARAKGMLVVFDRHYVDLFVDPRRYRYGGPVWLARLVGRFVPKPDIFIVLDLPAEVAHARKSEVPLEEARRLRKRYLELARSLPNAHVVDASRPQKEVVADVEDIILCYIAERTEVRLRRLGLVS